jgi:PTH1 family peptidyl-tRNA hydrolase
LETLRTLPSRLIVGLGNPGPAYADTRHNIGFMVLDALSTAHGIRVTESRCDALMGTGTIHRLPVTLAKPMTYMNRSGGPVRQLLDATDLTCRDIIVIHDDLDLAFGRLKITKKGGDGGHRGIKSIIDACGDDRFIRIRVGIGRSQADIDVVDHVLGNFTTEESTALTSIIENGRDAAVDLLCEGAEYAMNRYNRKGST